MRKKTIEAIQAHARQEYPRECCGVVIAIGRREQYVPCRNLSDKDDQFRMSGEDVAGAEDLGRLIAVVHSHPDGRATPSEADRIACEESQLPWHILALSETEFGELRTIKPSGYQPPLLGRVFEHGVLDCYTMVRDYYKQVRGVTLMDFEREDEWWDKGQDLYMQNFAKAGFSPLQNGESLDVGDVILMQFKAPVVNHAGIFIGESELPNHPGLFRIPDAMLHHLYGRLSERVVYGGHWRECTRVIVRYRG